MQNQYIITDEKDKDVFIKKIEEQITNIYKYINNISSRVTNFKVSKNEKEAVNKNLINTKKNLSLLISTMKEHIDSSQSFKKENTETNKQLKDELISIKKMQS